MPRAGSTPARKPRAAKAPTPTTRRTVKAQARPRAKGAAKRPGPPRPTSLEASYSSVLFRSRAEARWAIFFDLLGWSWDYEVCHYQLGELNYLPDFYLPDVHLWVEVKGPSFLDAAAMGKAASAVAGPHPLPSREAPYGPAGALALLGPIPAPGPGRPVHQLVVPTTKRGLAGMHRAVWEADGTLSRLGPKAWLQVPATGAKLTRRPAPNRVSEILSPARTGDLGTPRSLVRAYELAATTRFDDTTGTLARTTPGSLLSELAARRRGRPLGCAA